MSDKYEHLPLIKENVAIRRKKIPSPKLQSQETIPIMQIF